MEEEHQKSNVHLIEQSSLQNIYNQLQLLEKRIDKLENVLTKKIEIVEYKLKYSEFIKKHS